MKKVLFILVAIHCSLITASAQRWDSLSNGIKGSVNGLMVYGGNLIVGGSFDTAGGQPAYNIAQWNGTSWSNPFGSGISGPGTCTEARPMTIYNGSLIICGNFSSAGGITANNIAAWNGASWSNPFGSGCGVVWCGIGNDATIAAIVYNGKLIVGGRFSSANGIPVNNIAQWDGTKWDSLGSGVTGGGRTIEALDTFQGNLIVAGQFDSAGGQPAEHIAEWNGTSWSPLGSGCYRTGDIYAGVYSLTEYNGTLIAGGDFDSTGGQPDEYITQWDGTSWSNPFGLSIDPYGYNLYALMAYRGNLIVTGLFNIAGSSIAEWDGSAWSSPGRGIATDGIGITLCEYNKLLIAGGWFDTAGGIAIRSIASWCDTCPPLAVAEIKDKSEEVRVYPNPSNGVFQLSIRNLELGIKGQIEVYNMLGKKVYNGQFTMHNGQCKIDLSGQPAGIYMYRVITEAGKLVGDGKLVIEK